MLALFILFLISLNDAQDIYYNISVDINTILSEIPVPFYGFDFDWWQPNDSYYGQKWQNAGILNIDLNNPNLIALTSAISPAILRIGGSPQDSIIYNVSGECLNIKPSIPGYNCSQTANNYGCLNRTRWQQINNFATITNITLLFGLNACYGRLTKNTSMNFSNIQALLDLTSTIPNTQNLKGFEFGNELQHSIHPYIYATDFIKTQQMIQDTINSKPFLLGADNSDQDYAEEFILELQSMLKTLDVSSVLHGLTYHNYPSCPYPGNHSVFDLSCLDNAVTLAMDFNDLATDANVLAWMGEGAEHVHGGVPNVTNAFVDTFYYLWQLSEMLTHNIDATLRACLVGGDYELIDKNTFLPNPSYWILYLFKMFVGHKLYFSELEPYKNENFRAYSYNGENDEIVLVMINFDLSAKANVRYNINNNMTYNAYEYHLESYGATLESRIMTVNGRPLLYENETFPNISGIIGDGKTTSLLPSTLSFIVLF
eukprot:378806_1